MGNACGGQRDEHHYNALPTFGMLCTHPAEKKPLVVKFERGDWRVRHIKKRRRNKKKKY